MQKSIEIVEGYSKGELCNRGGCKGVISEREIEGSCSCHINPPCSYCTTNKDYCPECDWDAEEEQREGEVKNKPSQAQLDSWKAERDLWEAQYNSFFNKYNGREPIEKLEMRQRGHTNSSQKIFGVFPKGTETMQTILPKVAGTFGGKFNRFGDSFFEYTAYTD